MARTYLRNANLLDGERPAQPGVTVVIEDDRIVSVGSEGNSVRNDDRVVDLRGRTLMPGMVVGHFHPAYSVAHSATEAPESKQAIWAQGNAMKALKCGYTAGVGAGTFFDIDARLADAIDSGVVEGPRLIPASRAIAPGRVGGMAPEASPYIQCRGAEAVRAAVEKEIERGAKIIKLFGASGHALLGAGAMSTEELRAAVEVAEAHGVRTRAHVCGRDKVLDCVEAGIRIIDHADGMDDACIQAFLDNDCFVLPSLYMGWQSKVDPSLPGAELFVPEDFDYMASVLPKAVEAGVKFVPGDDYGFGMLDHGDYPGELVCYVEQCGIDPLEVIKWATKNGGELTDIEGLGTIAPGSLADMVIVDGDPSVDINVLAQPDRIVAVLKGGALASGELPAEQLALAS